MGKKNNKKLCETCKTGADSYALDKREPMCPYLHSHNGKTCSMYVPKNIICNKNLL